MKKKILLIDSLGALISGILLLVIAQFESLFGVSKDLASGLASLPFIFTIYSFLSYKYGNEKWKLLLKIIAMANLFYCVLTLYIIISNFKSLKSLGVAYFIGEILIIVLLSVAELKIAEKRD
jgi:F0F1-type ATP synthase assembly protein I